jgi:hypothetical protein
MSGQENNWDDGTGTGVVWRRTRQPAEPVT